MKILFICSGNTCRSPMAEGYLKSLNLQGVEVKSAGLSVGSFSAVAQNSVAAMKEMGIDISSHRPTQLSRDMAQAHDKIICMTATHKAILENAGVKADISVLGGGIFDPYGGDEDMYITCRNEIINEIDRLINNINLREFKKGDEKTIAEIEKQCFTKPWSEQGILDSVNSGTVFLVAEKAFRVAGYVSINTAVDEGYINNIAVAPKFRRQGIAERLLKRLDRVADEKQLSFISLEVRESNAAAIALYNKCGYQNMGVRKNFYENPKENAIIMTKTKRD